MQQQKEFRQLHQQAKPLILGNVWDVASARTFERLGFKALGTSSAAIASTLGYEDGEKITFKELLYLVKRIIANVKIPLSVDMEGGYSRNINEIIQNIVTMLKTGVVGINLEDGITNGEQKIVPVHDFCQTIKAIKDYLCLHDMKVFLNIRTDTYLLGLSTPLEDTLARIKAYKEAGADGIFVPGIVNKNDIKALVSSTEIPVNIMCMPDLPTFNELASLGVKRISMGNFAHNFMYDSLKNNIVLIQKNQSFKSLQAHEDS